MHWFDEQFNLSLTELDWDSTPGLCSLRHLGTTNREIFGWDGIRVDPERYHIVKETVRCRFISLLEGNPVSDPLNVFVKREPHKVQKCLDGKYRLISGVSLVDTLVDRILFGWLLRAAAGNVLKTPCMLGWAPVRGGWRFLAYLFGFRSVTCMDKASFDWTVVAWMIEAALDFLLQLPVNAPEWWKKMVRLRFRLLYQDCVYQFPDGTQVQQDVTGIQKSGCLLTLILNSFWQILLHAYACLELDWDPFEDMPLTLGDDTNQRWRRTVEELKAYALRLYELGSSIKSVAIQHWVDFAGFIVVGKSCIPAYWKKHLFKILYAENPVETLQQYQILYSHHLSFFEYLEKALVKLSPKDCLPLSWCRDVMDNESGLPPC